MTDEQLRLIRDFCDEEIRPVVFDPFYISPKTYDALGAIVKEVERLRAEHQLLQGLVLIRH